jgi:hypothetical protein
LRIGQGAPRANTVFSALRISKTFEFGFGSETRPKLVLIWKQLDAGVYGRRVDQIARSYRRQFQSHDVIIIQFIGEDSLAELRRVVDNVSSDAALILETIDSLQTCPVSDEGIYYENILYSKKHELSDKLLDVFANKSVLPSNSVVCVFQLLVEYRSIINLLHNYRVLHDFLDNQLSWSNEATYSSVASQYLSAIKNCRYGVFNSTENRDHFVSKYGTFLDRNAVLSVISNWYEKPLMPMSMQENGSNGRFSVVYSGNMNDRFDVELMEQLADALPAGRFHLFGVASRSLTQMRTLLAKENVIFHGPVRERQLVQHLQMMNLAIMPHLNDSISRYMNPIKLKMYGAFGLHCVSTAVCGISEDDEVTVVGGRGEFVAEVRRRSEVWAAADTVPPHPLSRESARPKEALAYFEFIERARADHAANPPWTWPERHPANAELNRTLDE